jgi:hypothetical protein
MVLKFSKPIKSPRTRAFQLKKLLKRDKKRGSRIKANTPAKPGSTKRLIQNPLRISEFFISPPYKTGVEEP